LMYYSALGM